MDASVLNEVASAVEPVDEAARTLARARLVGGGGLGRLEALAVELAGMRRRVDAPVARKAIIAVAADLGPADPAAALALRAAPPPGAPARAGGFQPGVRGGLGIAGAPMPLPVIPAGVGAAAGGRLAGRLAPAAAGYQIPASTLGDLGITRGDGSGAAAGLPLL